MSKEIRSKERAKRYGEFFTPPELVNEMLDKVPAEIWVDPSKTVLEPACGRGNFLVEILRRKIKGGSTPIQALQTCYGIELFPDNVEECKGRLLAIAMAADARWEEEYRAILDRHIVCADALSYDMSFGEEELPEHMSPDIWVIPTGKSRVNW